MTKFSLFLLRPQPWLAAAFLICSQAWGAMEQVNPDHITRGTLVSRNDQGDVQSLPLLETQVSIDVSGQLAKTELVQRFKNTTNRWIEAMYLFPLPQDAAVTAMRMELSGRQIEGQIKEKKQASAIYKAAKAAGQAAALVEQHRPNLFSTAVSNIPPGGEVLVTLGYQQSTEWSDHTFSLRFPMAVTPRYLPQQATHTIEGKVELSHGWQLLPQERAEALPVEAADSTPENATSIEVNLHPGFEVEAIESIAHEIEQTAHADGSYRITLKAGKVRADRDFVLSWTAAPSTAPSAAFFSESHDGVDYGQLSIMPPTVTNWEVPPREVIFVIDTSGSMGGASIEAAKKALLQGVSELSSDDTFNLIEFNSESRALFSRPEAATLLNQLQAQMFVRGLEADGGTEMLPALDLALQMPGESYRLQQVVFITDGSVANEREVFQQIHRNLGTRRLFTVGIGSAPNSYFMQESALAGRGTYTHIEHLDRAEATMGALFSKISKPALTDIRVESRGMQSITPRLIPDLYAGEPLQLAMQLQPGVRQVTVSARLDSTLWRQTIDIAQLNHESGVRVNWARQNIAQWLRKEFTGTDRAVIRDAVLELALKHHLVSPFTSLVAVDVTPQRPAEEDLLSQSVPPTRANGLELNMAQGATGFEWGVLMASLLLFLGWFGLLVSKRREPQAGEAA